MSSAGESSKRSNLIDVTYSHLHTLLSGHFEGSSTDQISEIIRPRLKQLENVAQPFGKPSEASKSKVDKGSVTLPDGVVVRVEDADKEYVFAVSKAFNIDEVDALVLFRSFLYNEGLPSTAGSNSDASLVDELIEAITPFYYSERIFVLRCLIPLFRASENAEKFLYPVASEFLPQILPRPNDFANTLINEYTHKIRAPLPPSTQDDPKSASSWAKQNVKEQLVILEVLFWTMWSYASCNGQLVVRIFESAYETNLGSVQHNATLLLDAESLQLQQDSAALWILLTIEVLELERVAEPGGINLTADKDLYWGSPGSLNRMHELVLSHEGSQFACTYIAWAFVLSRLSTVASELTDLPNSYRSFFDSLLPQTGRSFSKDREPVHMILANACLSPEVGLFKLLLTLLTTSPFFVTAVAWRTGSSVTDPNDVAYRSVFKGLIIAIVELVPVELIPDFDELVEVWIALFGRSESQSVAGICHQFWNSDWHQGIARRAIFDVARSRFPIQFMPLIQLLRTMTAAGFLDTDPLSTVDHAHEGEILDETRQSCMAYVFHYLNVLPTYTQVIPASACTGAHALYEKQPERYGTTSTSAGLNYINLRPIKLPGGTTLPAKSVGRLLSGDGGDLVVICWQHEHSGWKLLLELLTDYVNRRGAYSGSNGSYQDVSFGRRRPSQTLSLKMEDIGIEMDPRGDENAVMDALDLVRGVVQDAPAMAELLLESLEAGDPVVAHSMTESQPPDLVQLTTMILEEALSRSATQQRYTPPTPLITSAMSVLSALLAMPDYSDRVWLYTRSTASLFGSDRTLGVTSTVLAAERLTGHYTMTLSLLHLVQQLFNEASSSFLVVMRDKPHLQQVKEEVLMRAARFVHAEIWVEHMSWKYAQLGDRFEIGKRVSQFYTSILQNASPTSKDGPFGALYQAIAEALLWKATTSTVNPLVSSITTAGSVLQMLYASRRYGDARRLIFLLESHLLMTRTILNHKQRLFSSKPCLLEQALCTRMQNGAGSYETNSSKLDPVDALAGYIKERGMGSTVPVLAMKVMFSLCASLSSSEGAAPTIIGHLSDPEATVASLVRIIQHPYDDASLRNAVWNFVTLAIDKEPALAGLFVTGYFRIPNLKDKDKAEDASPNGTPLKSVSALNIARAMLEQWKELWELTPLLLAALLRFLDVVWQHAHEHKTSLESIRKDTKFMKLLGSIILEELGPVPDYQTENFIVSEGVQHSDLHEAVSIHAYRTAIKSYAVHILAMDIKLHLQSRDQNLTSKKPASYVAIQEIFQNEDQLTDYVYEASSSSYDPSLHDQLMEQIKTDFPMLTLDQVRIQDPIVERELGDDFAFSTTLFRNRLLAVGKEEQMEEAIKQLTSINLNLSLVHAQSLLTESWQHLLLQVVPFLRGDASVRAIVLSLAASISGDIASERRSGDMMSSIHSSRLSLLLSLIEIAWFSTSDGSEEVKSFVTLVKNIRNIILNSAQPPAESFVGQLRVPFHQTLLQIVYFCARHSRNLSYRPKSLTAEHRLTISSMLDATLVLVIDALRSTFDYARLRFDLELDQDMELLVAVFEQCTRPDLNLASTFWLTRCQETDIIRNSLDLFSHMDVVGLSDLPLFRARKRPLYAPHVLMFHMALASIPSAAERLASAGILIAYSENSISAAIRAGMIDVTLAELPGERSPAHWAYCTMLAIVAGVITALGHHGHYFDSEASGLIQLYGDQIHRTLSWTIGDPLTLPLLEEIEQVVNLFSAIARSTIANENDAVQRVLRFFTTRALLLLQQFNYALSHPNHLASLFESITADERTKLEADSGNSSINSPSEAVDPMKRPFLARLIHRVFRLTGSILAVLVDISKAEAVLIGEPEDWSLQEALVVPHSKVVLGEPASMGTLLELGNCAVDVLRHLVDRPAKQAITPSSVVEKPLDVQDSVAVIRYMLEEVLVYSATQLAMWVLKPEFDGSPNEMDADEGVVEGLGEMRDRRASGRQSITLAGRMRRGMTGEMAADLQTLLGKSKPIIAKAANVLKSKDADLTPILSHFVQERIIVLP